MNLFRKIGFLIVLCYSLTATSQSLINRGSSDRTFSELGTIRFQNGFVVPNISNPFYIYGTTDETTNYTRLFANYSNSRFVIGVQDAGTVSGTPLRLQSTYVDINNTWFFPNNIYWENPSIVKSERKITFNGGSSDHDETPFDFVTNGTINRSTSSLRVFSVRSKVNITANPYSASLISGYMDITSSSTVKSLLIDLGTTLGTTDTSKFRVDVDGKIIATGTATAAPASVGSELVTLNQLNNRTSLAANKNISTTYTVLLSDFGTNGRLYLYVNAASGAVTVNLPSSASMAGYSLSVIKTDNSANSVTIDPFGSEMVNQATTYNISGQNSNITITSDGTQVRLFN